MSRNHLSKAAEYSRRWRAKYPEKSAEHNRNSRWRGILKRHGLTQETYQAKVDSQNGCAICGGPPQPPKRYLSIDHNHKTNQMRGLLCDTCNRALGLFKDDIRLVAAAVEYLKQYEL